MGESGMSNEEMKGFANFLLTDKQEVM